jgi:hypothetical protein
MGNSWEIFQSWEIIGKLLSNSGKSLGISERLFLKYNIFPNLG